MNNPATNKPYKFALFEGIIPSNLGNRFISTHTPDKDETKLLDGRIAYRIIGYAETIEEAQANLYPSKYDADLALAKYMLELQRKVELINSP